MSTPHPSHFGGMPPSTALVLRATLRPWPTSSSFTLAYEPNHSSQRVTLRTDACGTDSATLVARPESPGNTGTAVQPACCEKNKAFCLGTRGCPSCTYRRLGAMLADLREPIARKITPRTDKAPSPHRVCPVRSESLVKNRVAREQERRDAPKNALNTVNLPWRARLAIMLQFDETQKWLQGWGRSGRPPVRKPPGRR